MHFQHVDGVGRRSEMSRGKLIPMKTKKPPNSGEWSDKKRSIRMSIATIKADALSTLEGVIGAESSEQACEILKTLTPDRKHLTFWLGQIARRKYVKLGKDLDFGQYLHAVVEKLRSAAQEIGQDAESKRKEIADSGRLQDHCFRNLLVFADCAVQADRCGVFDVLARNFDNHGTLSDWLNKVGYSGMSGYARGRDLIDYIRIVAHEIHEDMKKSIGKPVARW